MKSSKQIIVDFIVAELKIGNFNSFTTQIPTNEYYVYALINPLTNSVFYIGKGKGKRVLSHQKDFTTNKYKAELIFDLKQKGHNYNYIIVDNFTNEKDAFALEYLLINQLANQLTNISCAKQKAKSMWAEKVNQSIILEAKKRVKFLKSNGVEIIKNVVLFNNELYSTKIYRANILGQFVPV